MSQSLSPAKREILDAANRYIASRHGTPLNRRQVEQAVAVVRHQRLVKPSVLVAAGYNAVGPCAMPQRTLRPTRRQREAMADDG